jgi:prepilin-type N-terminal cleavage/methylation domain-containing protein
MLSNRAFTLLELLVVITIIGILASIVVVSMSGSTDSATIAKGKAYAQQVHALLGANAVGVWNFDEGIGTTLTDISGYGNNGTLNKGANGTGLDWVYSDIEGTALQFDGVDDYVDCGNNSSLDITDEITVESWVKMNTFKYGGVSIVGKLNAWTSGGWILYNLDSTPDKIVWGLATATGGSTIGFDAVSDKWYHVVGVGGGTAGQRLYVDGNLEDSANPANILLSAPTIPVYFGRLGANYLDGFMDEVRIYSEALSATEIQKHYVQGLKRLLANQAITQTEYDQRMEEFNQSLASSL